MLQENCLNIAKFDFFFSSFDVESSYAMQKKKLKNSNSNKTAANGVKLTVHICEF